MLDAFGLSHEYGDTPKTLASLRGWFEEMCTAAKKVHAWLCRGLASAVGGSTGQ